MVTFRNCTVSYIYNSGNKSNIDSVGPTLHANFISVKLKLVVIFFPTGAQMLAYLALWSQS